MVLHQILVAFGPNLFERSIDRLILIRRIRPRAEMLKADVYSCSF